MKRTIIETADGSKTIFIEEMEETYHSIHGAIQEAELVFIKNGLGCFETKKEISIFELGFGTGLNALLTWIEAEKLNLKIDYIGIEAFPVERELWSNIEYADQIGGDSNEKFLSLHTSEWEKKMKLNDCFSITKIEKKIQDFENQNETVDLIFFDAFGPRAQSEMWSIAVLTKMHEMLKPEGILVTYCASGQFKRDLKSIGFSLEALPGPPGKREMTRATRRS